MPESDLHYVASLPRPELRNALRRAQAFDPPLRILAEDVLGADAPIDFIAVDPDGRVPIDLGQLDWSGRIELASPADERWHASVPGVARRRATQPDPREVSLGTPAVGHGTHLWSRAHTPSGHSISTN